MFSETLTDKLHEAGVLAVLTIDSVEDAVPVAKALYAGGVGCMELTLRTPATMEVLRRIRAEVPEMIAGVGTVITPQQVREIAIAGAAFGVAPGTNPRVMAEAQAVGLSFAPGISTPSDIERAVEHGCRVLKFFPAEQLGGLSYLKSIAVPYAHLDLSFIPLGGVDASNAEKYLREPIILALGGSWIAPRSLIQKQDWWTITQQARQASDIVEKLRPRIKA